MHCVEMNLQCRKGLDYLSIYLKIITMCFPIHADTWNGVSPFELNIWIPFVDCSDSMSSTFSKETNTVKSLKVEGLLKLTSDELFDVLRDDLTWIPIKYGQVLAFDQSLPHGYSLNKEIFTHWSMNCRFKGLHTPYWDKKLGEYFMPITVRTSTRLEMNYSHLKTGSKRKKLEEAILPVVNSLGIEHHNIFKPTVKAYCDFNDLTFVLSRAEYWIDGNTNCQLWAALKEGFRHIVFFSIWQLLKYQ